ncbi:DUF2066 domain-containing protein [Vibrio alfacsensis]|uniref:DUF2066 domain-containing protein n=1 Tax=Vibrio alfacsensis TaxID=1074311 RepID=UPI002ADD3EC7|nr:DUF2066 domain-containing protein [Vibrio alfacsensis]WQE75508.1 DUF2066 domain-containing protein [Vibrio alfacsensis]
MRYLALLLVGWLSLPVYALTQVDIYRAEVAIDGEQKDGESLARQQGMKDVIVRATGSQSSLSNPVIEKAVGTSSRYISQLSYGQVDGQNSLKMLFNSDQIRSLLTQAQLPFWSANRANILVWLVEEHGYDRTITWEHTESPTVATLRSAAENRGLPITMPVGDIDDVTGVSISDLWGGFIDPISQASQRYPVDAVLVIRVQGDSIRWSLYDQSPSKIVESQMSPRSGSASGANAMTAMMNGIADYYATKSAVIVSSESSESIDVKILNVSSARDFFNLENALTQLNSVASTEIKRVQGNEVTLKVHLLASQQAFEQEASAISQLMVFDDPLGAEDNVAHEPVSQPKAEDTLPAEVVSVDGAATEASTSDATASDVATTELAASDVTEPSVLENSVNKVAQEPVEAVTLQPAVTEPVKETYDLIYEWRALARSLPQPDLKPVPQQASELELEDNLG